MKVFISCANNLVTIDDEVHTVDVSDLPSYISCIQWLGEGGWIEFVNDGRGKFLPNQTITDFSIYNWVVEKWKIAKENHDKEKIEEETKFREQQAEIEKQQRKIIEKSKKPRPQR